MFDEFIFDAGEMLFVSGNDLTKESTMKTRIWRKDQWGSISVDTNKNSRKFQDINWQFINTRDDNFGVIEKYIDKELDVIYLDTIHKADHVEKIIYKYYDKLKVGGFFFHRWYFMDTIF